MSIASATEMEDNLRELIDEMDCESKRESREAAAIRNRLKELKRRAANHTYRRELAREVLDMLVKHRNGGI